MPEIQNLQNRTEILQKDINLYLAKVIYTTGYAYKSNRLQIIGYLLCRVVGQEHVNNYCFLLFQVEALCVLLANSKSGGCNAEKIVLALHSSGSKLGLENSDLVNVIPELQAILI